MKKLILSVALLAGMTFIACSDDDSKKNDNCVPCAALEAADEVCKGDNGNAFVIGIDTQVEFDEYVDAMCGDDPGTNPTDDCQTCGIQGVNIEICKGENGNAYAHDMDTGMKYETYIQSIEAGGANCN